VLLLPRSATAGSRPSMTKSSAKSSLAAFTGPDFRLARSYCATFWCSLPSSTPTSPSNA
jgi:hypothetical protein